MSIDYDVKKWARTMTIAIMDTTFLENQGNLTCSMYPHPCLVSNHEHVWWSLYFIGAYHGPEIIKLEKPLFISIYNTVDVLSFAVN